MHLFEQVSIFCKFITPREPITENLFVVFIRNTIQSHYSVIIMYDNRYRIMIFDLGNPHQV